MRQNALWNCKNPYQGTDKKVLCVCSAGLLRSPTAAWVLSQDPYNFNTRAAGVHDYALIQVDEVLAAWADEILVMDANMIQYIPPHLVPKVRVLNIPDNYPFKDPALIDLIKERYDALI